MSFFMQCNLIKIEKIFTNIKKKNIKNCIYIKRSIEKYINKLKMNNNNLYIKDLSNLYSFKKYFLYDINKRRRRKHQSNITKYVNDRYYFFHFSSITNNNIYIILIYI